jgi:hypothetical protein
MTASQPAALRSAMGRTRSMRMRQQQQQKQQQQQQQQQPDFDNSSNNTHEAAKKNSSAGDVLSGGAASPSVNSSLGASSTTTQQQQQQDQLQQQRRVRFQLSNNKTSKKSNNGADRSSKQGGDDGEDDSSSLTTTASSLSSTSSSSSSMLNQNKKAASPKGAADNIANKKGSNSASSFSSSCLNDKNGENKRSNSSLNDQNLLQLPPPKRPVKINGAKGDDDDDVFQKSSSGGTSRLHRRPPKSLFSTSTIVSTTTAAAVAATKQHRSSVNKVMDIDAANNASRNQMLEDEVYDLCGSIRSSLTCNSNINNNNSDRSMSCLEAAVELANIVSVRKQRQVLFRKHFQMAHNNNNNNNNLSSRTTSTRAASSSSSPLGKDWGIRAVNSPSPSRRCQRGKRDEQNDDDESHHHYHDDDSNHDGEEMSPLGAILDLLAWMTTRSTLTAADIEEDDDDGDHEQNDQSSVMKTANNTASAVLAPSAARTKTARASQEIAEGTDKNNGKNASVVAAAAPQVPQVWNVMAMIVHFLSLDCTLQPCDIEALGLLVATSSSSSSTSLISASPSRKTLLDSIRSFRHAILSHASGLQGMLLLVLQETSLANTRRKQGTSLSLPARQCSVAGSAVGGARRSSPLVSSSVLQASDGPLVRNPTSHDISGTWGGGSSVASSSSSSSPSLGSTGSGKKLDPTAAGRKRRRKIRLPLPTIDEDDIRIGGDNIDHNSEGPSLFKRRKRQEKKKHLGNDDGDDDDDDNMSFSLESPTPPRRSIVSSLALGNFGADDFSSMASSSTASVAAVATDASSLAGLEQANETQEKLNRVISRVLESMPDEETGATDQQQRSRGMKTKTAKSDEPSTSIALWQRSKSLHLPLVALHRIVTGRMEGMDRGCLDDDLHAVGDNPETEDDDDEDLEHTEHPQMITNRLLFESGVIPLLSQAMSKTAVSITSTLKQAKTSTTGSPCASFAASVSHLLKRLSLLRSLVDDACSFNEANRKSICQEGYTVEAGGFLIVNLVSVLVALIETNSLFVDDGLGEIGFEVLRTLNGLAHENKVAAKELEMSLDYSKVVGANASMNDNYCSGLDVVARVLFLAVGKTSENQKCPDDSNSAVDKLVYDAKVFSLTLLGNALESGASPRIFAEMKFCPKKSNVLFLPWLVKFLGNETRPFRDALLGSTFGSSPSKHAERRLDQQEDEKLFTAGYGLTLVTSLLVGPLTSSSPVNNNNKKREKNAQQAVMRELILPELPGDDEDAKLMFVKNTLKAFCNLYHFSVNEDLSLSMLVLAPIKKLLVELDRSMNEKE